MGCNSPGSTHHRACDCRESAHAEEVARLRAENARLLSMLGDEVVWLQASGDFSPMERLNRIFALRRALAADAPEGEEKEKSNG